MPGTDEDKRAAVNIETSLSSYLMTAALAVIGAEAAVLTFVLDKREKLGSFYFVSGLGFLLLVASIYHGGRGIMEVYKNGFAGKWGVQTSKRDFNRQAILSLLGVILVFASVVVAMCIATPKPQKPSLAATCDSLKMGLPELKEELSALRSQFAAQEARGLSAPGTGTRPTNRTKK